MGLDFSRRRPLVYHLDEFNPHVDLYFLHELPVVGCNIFFDELIVLQVCLSRNVPCIFVGACLVCCHRLVQEFVYLVDVPPAVQAFAAASGCGQDCVEFTLCMLNCVRNNLGRAFCVDSLWNGCQVLFDFFRLLRSDNGELCLDGFKLLSRPCKEEQGFVVFLLIDYLAIAHGVDVFNIDKLE